jgi:hypothetical protein
MRTLIVVLFLVIQVWLTGCAKYQYAAVSSNMKENARNEHILENDTLMIKYVFNGQNCPVTVSIQNKLDIPLYVDWKRSAVMLNDQSYSYWNDKATIRGTTDGAEIQLTSVVSSAHSSFTGEIVRDESVSFIPPRSFKETSMISIQDDFFELPGKKGEHREELIIGDSPVYGFLYEFFKEESPLYYRSYLTLSTSSSFTNPVTYENEFWVSEVFETTSRPERYFQDKENINKFYTTKTTGFGTFMAVTGVVALALLLSL